MFLNKDIVINIFNNIKLHTIKLNLNEFVFLISLLNSIFFTYPLFSKLLNYNFNKITYFLVGSLVFLLSLAISNILYSIILWKKSCKYIAFVLFFINSIVLYYMAIFNIAIDFNMIVNLFETNTKEAKEFITIKFILFILSFNIVFGYIIFKKILIIDNTYYIKQKIISIFISICFAISIITPCYLFKSSFLFLRHNQTTINFLIPVNYIGGIIEYSQKSLSKKFHKKELISITNNLKFTDNKTKKKLIFFVIGESARSKNFSLNGYDRNTNEFLEKQNNLISFKNFYSCETSTEPTLICTFSHFSRNNFNYNKAFKYETLLHILNKVGIKVIWRSNNGKCKQIACKDGTISNSIVKSFGTELYDDLLLKSAKFNVENLTNSDKNVVLFLHMWGSHGPIYANKFPKNFQKFNPSCETSIEKCDLEKIVNSYDNSLYYSSYIVNEMIEYLKTKEKEYNVGLIFMSDHGESLGENNIFLHSAPYDTAPIDQKNPAFFIWFSQDFADEFNLDLDCLKQHKDDYFSQDNIFHSMLGLFDISSKFYQKELDIFNICKKTILPQK